MIEIKLAPETALVAVCEKLGVPKTRGLLIYVARDDAEELGWCGFCRSGEEGELLFSHVAENSLLMLEDGLLRCALSYFYEHGVSGAYCRGSVDPRLLKRLGFTEHPCGLWHLDFAGSFLEQGCAGEQK